MRLSVKYLAWNEVAEESKDCTTVPHGILGRSLEYHVINTKMQCFLFFFIESGFPLSNFTHAIHDDKSVTLYLLCYTIDKVFINHYTSLYVSQYAKSNLEWSVIVSFMILITGLDVEWIGDSARPEYLKSDKVLKILHAQNKSWNVSTRLREIQMNAWISQLLFNLKPEWVCEKWIFFIDSSSIQHNGAWLMYLHREGFNGQINRNKPLLLLSVY